MRREIPYDVDVRLKQPEIDPHRVDVQHVAQAARFHLTLHFLDRAREEIRVIDKDFFGTAGAEVEQPAGFVHRGRQRLFDQDVTTGLETPTGNVVMLRDGNGDGHQIRPRSEQRLYVTRCKHTGIMCRDLR